MLSAHALVDIDLTALWETGKRLILLDVDNTLVQWKSNEFSDAVVQWVNEAKRMGFDLCIVSNTRRVTRLHALAQDLGVDVVRGRMKPSRSMFVTALNRFQREPHEAVMVGDQLVTDVLGANRSGIDAVWLKPMEGKEFVGTKINRAIERFLTGAIYRALVVPVDTQDTPESSRRPIWERKIFQQFVKFCIVGGTSFVIDAGLRLYLLHYFPYRGGVLKDTLGAQLKELPLFAFAATPTDAAFAVVATFSASIAILNSFIWNRMWTFEIRGKAERASQLRKFVVVSIMGLVLNVTFSSLFNHLIPGESKLSMGIATALAAMVVAVWNFSGQRFWAFRARKR